MKPQESERPAATSNPADTPSGDLEQKIAQKHEKARHVFLNADRTPRLVPPQAGFREEIKKRLADIHKHTPTLHPLFFRVYAGQSGLTEAVKAKCLDCSCWQIAEITDCRVFTCPLWAHRPYQKEAAGESKRVGVA
jgi:hypothetical protein